MSYQKACIHKRPVVLDRFATCSYSILSPDGRVSVWCEPHHLVIQEILKLAIHVKGKGLTCVTRLTKMDSYCERLNKQL